jgi:hypothetical protein
MSVQLVHDVHVVNPFPVSIYPTDAGISFATTSKLSAEQAVVDCILHGVARSRKLKYGPAQDGMISVAQQPRKQASSLLEEDLGRLVM